MSEPTAVPAVPEPEDYPTPNYRQLIANLRSGLPEYRHIVCLDPKLVAPLRQAMADRQAAAAQKKAQGDPQKSQRRMNALPPVEAAEEAYQAAKAAHDRACVVFVVVAPSADDESMAQKELGQVGRELFNYEVVRARLLGGLVRVTNYRADDPAAEVPAIAMNEDGEPEEMGFQDYATVLRAMPRQAIEMAGVELAAAASMRPDFPLPARQ